MIDKSNMIKVLEDFPLQCRDALTLAKGLTVSGPINKIIVTGMGGSAIGGDLLKSYMHDSKIPVTVNRDYNLPKFVDENTLVFATSYSGNTEETLSCFHQAAEKNAKIIAITTGGKLAELSKKNIKVPSGIQPRNAVAYLFFPMLGVLYNSGLVNVKNSEVNEMLILLKDINYFKGKGEKLAKKIKERTPIIYSSTLFEPVAYRWRCEFQENAKSPAYHHVYPEMNHNEINASMNMQRSKFVVVQIRDKLDHPRIKKRMDICRDIMEARVDVEEVNTKGDSLLARMFSTILLGDFASYYLAVQNRIDPTPVEVIEGLKKKLNE